MKYSNIALLIDMIQAMPLRAQDQDHKIPGTEMHLHYFRSVGVHAAYCF